MDMGVQMIFTRIRSYYSENFNTERKFTGCEQICVGNDKAKALERFLHYYPSHRDCVQVIELIDGDDERYKEYIDACFSTGCYL